MAVSIQGRWNRFLSITRLDSKAS